MHIVTNTKQEVKLVYTGQGKNNFSRSGKKKFLKVREKSVSLEFRHKLILILEDLLQEQIDSSIYRYLHR